MWKKVPKMADINLHPCLRKSNLYLYYINPRDLTLFDIRSRNLHPCDVTNYLTNVVIHGGLEGGGLRGGLNKERYLLGDQG